MKRRDITLLVGVDAWHLKELRWAWPTWMRFKPEIREMPMILFYDNSQIVEDQLSVFLEHPHIRLIPWEMDLARNQREKMISGFIHVAAREIETPWYLKLDTDAVATGEGVWIKSEWFDRDGMGREAVFISSSWGYSKPRYVMDLLDDWGDTTSLFLGFPRLNIPYACDSDRVVHDRIISWIFFGNTAWTIKMTEQLDISGRLPYPSQDTFLFYCAARSQARYIRERMSRYHWAHRGFTQLRRIVTELGLRPAKECK